MLEPPPNIVGNKSHVVTVRMLVHQAMHFSGYTMYLPRYLFMYYFVSIIQ